MTLEYKSSLGLEGIAAVLDEHVFWYGRLMRAYFERRGEMEPVPTIFTDWLSKAIDEDNISAFSADKASRIHQGLVKSDGTFAKKATTWDVNPLEEFNELTRHYEEFIQFMRQVERDQTLENSGIDDKTGLRSLKVLKDDVAREMDRKSRRGRPFCLILIKINEFDPVWMSEHEPFMLTIRKISDQIRFCLRSFDDAYYLGADYFLAILKQTDKVGGQAAVTRFNESIKDAHIAPPGGNRVQEISINSVVAEPTEEDDLDKLIENLKRDLSDVAEKGAVLQYNEVSPSQRYRSSISKK